jgi:mono/diheme cytochrome c family protein
MRARKLAPSRWLVVPAAMIAIVLLSGCGRVNLVDLTPEAFKTQQAIDAANQPTAEPTTEGDGSPAAGTEASGDNPLAGGDIAGGDAIYNSQCSGCHEGGRAASLKGNVFDPAVEIPKLRSGEGFGADHPKYTLTAIRPLNDADFIDIFAYLAAQ